MPIEETAAAGTEMLKKSQMSLFDPHHVAYTRTNASGTVSNIAAKGALKETAKKASENAQSLTATTHYSKMPEAHTEAAEAHREAARLHLIAGDTQKATRHEQTAKEHESHAAKASQLKDMAEANQKKQAYQRMSERADELTRKADDSNSSMDHETARLVHQQAAGTYPKGSPKRKYHIDMARYHSARP